MDRRSHLVGGSVDPHRWPERGTRDSARGAGDTDRRMLCASCRRLAARRALRLSGDRVEYWRRRYSQARDQCRMSLEPRDIRRGALVDRRSVFSRCAFRIGVFTRVLLLSDARVVAAFRASSAHDGARRWCAVRIRTGSAWRALPVTRPDECVARLVHPARTVRRVLQLNFARTRSIRTAISFLRPSSATCRCGRGAAARAFCRYCSDCL
jgi:hypothetical protein